MLHAGGYRSWIHGVVNCFKIHLRDSFNGRMGRLQRSDVGSIPVFRTLNNSDMIKKITEIHETTIYVGDKLVVIKKEVDVVRVLDDKPED